jgi:hypothetical protein
MTDTIVIQPQINTLTITEDANDVVISSVGAQGIQGPAGATGAKGDTGDQGPSGVVTVNAPLTNAGTSSAANLSISAGTTSAAGALQLTDSVASTSTTTAATPNAVKDAYDIGLIKPIVQGQTGFFIRTPQPVLNSTGVTNNQAIYAPIYVKGTKTFDRIAISTSATFSGSASVRLGIYNSGTDGKPSTVVLDAGTVSPTASSTIYQITINQTLSEGIYWVVFVQQTAPTVGNYVGATNSAGSINNLMNAMSGSISGNTYMGYSQNSVTGALATASGVNAAVSTPYVYLRFA